MLPSRFQSLFHREKSAPEETSKRHKFHDFCPLSGGGREWQRIPQKNLILGVARRMDEVYQ